MKLNLFSFIYCVFLFSTSALAQSAPDFVFGVQVKDKGGTVLTQLPASSWSDSQGPYAPLSATGSVIGSAGSSSMSSDFSLSASGFSDTGVGMHAVVVVSLGTSVWLSKL